MTDQKKRALIIFPTYNEKENIEEIITAVLAIDDSIHALVVDDNSPDGTGQIVDQMAATNPRVFVEHRTSKAGLGAAYIHGFKWAIREGFDYIFEMDADFSHDPKYIPAFLKAIQEYDLVLGSRYIKGGGVVNWPFKRRFLSRFGNIYARLITWLPVHDATGGFKCFRREVLEAIDLEAVRSNGYTFQIEMTMRARAKKFSVKEIPIVFSDRQLGDSKMSRAIIREAVRMVWWLRWAALTGKL